MGKNLFKKCHVINERSLISALYYHVVIPGVGGHHSASVEVRPENEGVAGEPVHHGSALRLQVVAGARPPRHVRHREVSVQVNSVLVQSPAAEILKRKMKR